MTINSFILLFVYIANWKYTIKSIQEKKNDLTNGELPLQLSPSRTPHKYIQIYLYFRIFSMTNIRLYHIPIYFDTNIIFGYSSYIILHTNILGYPFVSEFHIRHTLLRKLNQVAPTNISTTTLYDWVEEERLEVVCLQLADFRGECGVTLVLMLLVKNLFGETREKTIIFVILFTNVTQTLHVDLIMQTGAGWAHVSLQWIQSRAGVRSSVKQMLGGEGGGKRGGGEAFVSACLYRACQSCLPSVQ